MTNMEETMSTGNTPKDFKDLDAKELYRSALEDFALDVDPEDKNKKKVLLAAFVEGGVSWPDYVAQHPEVAPEEPAAGVVTAGTSGAHNQVGETPALFPEDKWDPNAEQAERLEPVVAAEPVVVTPVVAAPQVVDQPYLIKMVRENPLFEVRGYKFTSAHPYALVRPEDVEYILNEQDGFRQAFPSELQEFYAG